MAVPIPGGRQPGPRHSFQGILIWKHRRGVKYNVLQMLLALHTSIVWCPSLVTFACIGLFWRKQLKTTLEKDPPTYVFDSKHPPVMSPVAVPYLRPLISDSTETLKLYRSTRSCAAFFAVQKCPFASTQATALLAI